MAAGRMQQEASATAEAHRRLAETSAVTGANIPDARSETGNVESGIHKGDTAISGVAFFCFKCSEKRAPQNPVGNREIDDEPGDVDERRHKGRGRGCWIEAALLQGEWEH